MSATRMRIAVIATYVHPTRLPIKEPSIMQSAVPELIAALCPDDAEVELYNEKEGEIPLDRDWDLVFFSYLHSYYEHTKVLSTILRKRGTKTVAGGRHASYFSSDCGQYFDAVVKGDPEPNVPALIQDFRRGRLQPLYDKPLGSPEEIKPYRYDLIDFKTNPYRLPAVEASRGCPFTCNFCVLTGWEKYRYRPVKEVVAEIQFKMRWNKNYFRLFEDVFIFLDNNLGGSPKYLRELCEALIPMKKIWGCALTFNILRDEELVRLMSRAGCRYIYTGIESLSPDSIESMDKRQNRLDELGEVVRRSYSNGILLAFGLIVGADGDTSDYLLKVPDYLADVGQHAITYLGIVCPYPETPYFKTLVDQGRLLPNVVSRDLDGYTLCHRPSRLTVKETIEHYRRLAEQLSSLRSLARHYWSTLWASDAPRYKKTILVSAREIASIRHAVSNPARTLVAGYDPIEDWDRTRMIELGLAPQPISGLPAHDHSRRTGSSTLGALKVL